MAIYKYVARDINAKKITGKTEARDEHELSQLLRVKDMYLISHKDITKEETVREKKEALSRQTIEITDKVIDKQMRVVQEIASLLGETTAETKIALTKLKETLNNE